MYALVAGQELEKRLAVRGDPAVSKEQLVRAHGGDYSVFERMDTDADGRISLEEWLAWLQAEHQRKGKHGDKHTRTFLHTLKTGATQCH